MKLSHQATILFWGRLTSQLALVVRAMIFSRMMDKETYGTYGQAMMIGMLVTPYLALGLDRAVPFFFTKLSEQKQKGLVSMLCIYLSLAGVLTGLVLFFGGDLVARQFDNPDLVRLLKYYAFVVAFSQLPVIVPPALLTKRLPLLSGVYLPAMEVPGVAAALATYYLTRSLETMFLVIAGMRALHCLAGFLLMVHLPFKEVAASFDRHLPWEVLKYAVPLGAAIMVAMTTRTFDRLFISSYYTPADFAVYRNGAFELPLFMLLTASVFTVLLPEMARLAHAGRTEAVIRLWSEGVRRCAIFLTPLAVFTFIFAEDIIIFLFSEKYRLSVPIFRIYTASLLIRITMYDNVFVAFGRPKYILLLSIISLILTVVGCFACMPIVGFYGPAVACLITRYIRIALSLILIARVSGISLRRAAPWGAVGRLIACSIVACAAAYPLMWVEMWPLVRLILAFAVTATVFAVAAFLSRTVTRQDADFIVQPVLNRWRAWRRRGTDSP
jgi:O-antigen/teichoic acid export membrane protein